MRALLSDFEPGFGMVLGGRRYEGVFEGSQLAEFLSARSSSFSGQQLLDAGLIEGVPHTNTFRSTAYLFTRSSGSKKMEKAKEKEEEEEEEEEAPDALELYSRILDTWGKPSNTRQRRALEELALGFSGALVTMEEPRLVPKPGCKPLNVFECSMEDTMVWQRQKGGADPRLNIPACLLFLGRLVVRLGGLRAQGLFRVSPRQRDLDTLKKHISHGYYTEAEESVSDPHAPAVLIKLYFLDNSTAIFDHAAAMEACESERKALALCSRLDSDRAHALSFIIALFRRSQANIDTLVNVFSPCLLHAPSSLSRDLSSYQTILEKERAFTRIVLEHYSLIPADPNSFDAVRYLDRLASVHA